MLRDLTLVLFLFWWQALEVAGCIYLYEEYEAEQDANLIGGGQVGVE